MTAQPQPRDAADRPYDAERDFAESWWLAMRTIGERVRAGEPVPDFMRSERGGPPGRVLP